MNKVSELLFRGLPVCVKGNRHIVVINEDHGLITLTASDTENGKYFISVSENHLIFETLDQNKTLVLHKRELFERYGIAFVDFKTTSQTRHA